jgi:hypothetical protein
MEDLNNTVKRGYLIYDESFFFQTMPRIIYMDFKKRLIQ